MKRTGLYQSWSLFLTLLFLASVLFVVTPTGRVGAQDTTPSDDEVNAIARKLYCPVCENVPLDVCPTQACKQWREEIRLRLAQGWSEEEILQYFADQYGVRVLAEPPRKGLNWLVYIIPPLAFGLGAYILFRALRSWRALDRQAVEARPVETKAPEGEEQDAYISRLEEELKKRG